ATGLRMNGSEIFIDYSAGTGSAPAGTRPASGFPADRDASPVTQMKMDGVVYSVNSWLINRPPIMVIPKGRRNSDPLPEPSANGTAPSSAAMVVIMMGRKRRRHAW